MSLALYLSDSEAQQFHDYVSNSPVISARKNIGYHVVFKTGVSYPFYSITKSKYFARIVSSIFIR